MIVAARCKSSSRGVYNSNEFLCKTFLEVEVGQEVIIDIPTYGLSVAMITKVDVDLPRDIKLSDVPINVIQIVDKSAYYAYLAHEHRLKTLKEEMDSRVKDITANDLYEKLAKEDEVLASLLIDYKTELGKYTKRDS